MVLGWLPATRIDSWNSLRRLTGTAAASPEAAVLASAAGRPPPRHWRMPIRIR